MKYQEKKYKVDSFVTISKLLNEKGAKKPASEKPHRRGK